MKTAARPLAPQISVIVPAHNEAEGIGACLEALMASTGVVAQVIVVANGCTDETAAKAQAFVGRFEAKGWHAHVLDLSEGGKPGALSAGDAVATAPIRAYLDADVTVSAALLAQLVAQLSSQGAAYASGTLQLAAAKSAATRAYARIYSRVPFLTHGVPGAGLFAMNEAGRARWGDWPEIISDDTFARLNFAPCERHAVLAPYTWPLVEGWRALVRVRRRQNRGVSEIAARYPHLMANDDKPDFPTRQKLRLAASDPLGFAIYAGVALATKLKSGDGWERGR